MPKCIKQLAQSPRTKTAISLLTIVLIVHAAIQLLPHCNNIGSDIDLTWIIGAAVLGVAYRVINAYGWTLVMRSTGQHVDGSLATAIWLRAESRRWLPGGMWGYASRAVQAKELGVSLSLASASMFLELILTLVASLLTVIPVSIAYSAEFSTVLVELGLDSLNSNLVILTGLCVLVCAVAAKYFLKRKSKVLQSRLDSLSNVSVNWTKLFQALLFFVWMACLNGLISLILIGALYPNSFPPIAVVIAATSISWLVGFFAVFAPGGVVVREGTFAIAMMFWLPIPDGFMVAVAARLIQMLAEVICLSAVSINRRKAAKTSKTTV